MREWLERMRWKTAQWMQGRNGMDDLARMCYIVGLVLLVLTLLTGSGFINLLATIALVYSVFRITSANVQKRQQENVLYLQKTERIRKEYEKYKYRFDLRKEYCFFKCKCGTVLRVKRGQGMKEITCPVCHEKMTRNTH